MNAPQIQVVNNGTIVTGITIQQCTTANDKRVRKSKILFGDSAEVGSV
jgi:hypothetical protein